MDHTSTINRITRLIAIVGLLFTIPFMSAFSFITLQVPEYPSDNTTRGQEELNAIFALSHTLDTPFDPSSGLPNGTTKHEPISITKRIDKSTPGFYQALYNNEVLPAVTLNLYRNNPSSGETEVYYTVELINARIVSMKSHSPLVLILENEDMGHLETVKFTYQTIHWTYHPAGTEAQANWGGR